MLMAVQVSYDAAFTACASRRFAEALSAPGSYASLKAVTEAARRIWWNDVTVQDWLESFEANAVLGDAGDSLHDCCMCKYTLPTASSISALTPIPCTLPCCLTICTHRHIHAAAEVRLKFMGTHSALEQAAALAETDPRVFEDLASLNACYLERHGFKFMLCAFGKSAVEVRDALRARLPNNTYAELGAAAEEQIKITVMRLERQLSVAPAVTGSHAGSSGAAFAAARRIEQLTGHLSHQAAGQIWHTAH